MIDDLAEELAGPGWGAMSAGERDLVRAAVMRMVGRIRETFSYEMAHAGRRVLDDNRLIWSNNEARAKAVWDELWEALIRIPGRG